MLIQKTDPIYADPTGSSFRSHFFAPRKKVGGKYFDTYWVNSAVIWLMSILLIATLYFDVFKKILDGLESVFSRPFSD